MAGSSDTPVSPAGFLCQEGCLLTVAETGWSPVTRNLYLDQVWWVYHKALLDQGWVGRSQCVDYFEAHSQG